MGCLECNNEKGYYRKENDQFNCYKDPPNKYYALDPIVKEWRKCNEIFYRSYIGKCTVPS